MQQQILTPEEKWDMDVINKIAEIVSCSYKDAGLIMIANPFLRHHAAVNNMAIDVAANLIIEKTRKVDDPALQLTRDYVRRLDGQVYDTMIQFDDTLGALGEFLFINTMDDDVEPITFEVAHAIVNLKYNERYMITGGAAGTSFVYKYIDLMPIDLTKLRDFYIKEIKELLSAIGETGNEKYIKGYVIPDYIDYIRYSIGYHEYFLLEVCLAQDGQIMTIGHLTGDCEQYFDYDDDQMEENAFVEHTLPLEFNTDTLAKIYTVMKEYPNRDTCITLS